MDNKIYWTLNSILSFAVIGAVHTAAIDSDMRSPASNIQSISLELKHVQLGHESKIPAFEGVNLRATFNRKHVVDLLGGKSFSLSSGNMAELNIKLPIEPSWIQNDQLEINLEFVKKGFIDQIVMRCAHVSKKISEYNRSYQCFVPGETLALVTYRLGDEKVGLSTLAQHK